MLNNMQWRAGLMVINHARQKDRTVFSAKKSQITAKLANFTDYAKSRKK